MVSKNKSGDAMELKPYARTIDTFFIDFNVDQFTSAVSDICNNSVQITGKIFNVSKTTIDLADGQIDEDVAADNLSCFIKDHFKNAQSLSIALHNKEAAMYMGLPLHPEEYVFIAVNFMTKKISLTISLVGKEQLDKIATIFFAKIDYLNISLPEEHKYIQPFLTKFLLDNPAIDKNVFLIMRFREEKPLCEIPKIINGVCSKYNLKLLRADGKEYTSDLWGNVLTYLYGCSCGIAIFDEINNREFNPNVAIETGFMLALRKHILFLKDKAIKAMPSDITGQIYKPFDTYDCPSSIPIHVEKWINDFRIGKR